MLKLWLLAFRSRGAKVVIAPTFSFKLQALSVTTSFPPINSMKLTSFLLPVLYANIATARATSGWFGSNDDSQLRLQDDDPLNVPGENPLKFCADPKDNILKIIKADLDPNPPKAYVLPSTSAVWSYLDPTPPLQPSCYHNQRANFCFCKVVRLSPSPPKVS